MIVKFKKSFDKSYNKLDFKIKLKFKEKLKNFYQNPTDEILNNHALTWDYKWYRSINITWDFRAIFREYPDWTYEFVEFIDIWTHSQLY